MLNDGAIMVEQNDISDKIHVLAIDLEKFKSTANLNHDEILKLYDKLEKINNSFTELKVHVDNLAARVSETNDNCKLKSHDYGNLMIDITRLTSSVNQLNVDIKELKDGIQKHMCNCSNQMNSASAEIGKFKNNETLMNVTLDDLKSDISDLEQSINELERSTSSRLDKLEEVRNGYKVLKWIGGVIAGVLGFAFMIYEFYEKIVK